MLPKHCPESFSSLTPLFLIPRKWKCEGSVPDRPIVTTTRYTVPLGALTGSDVWKYDIPLSLSKSVEAWVVTLKTTSKVMLSETHEDVRNTTKNEGQDRVSIGFYDKTIANRVFWRGSTTVPIFAEEKEPFDLPFE